MRKSLVVLCALFVFFSCNKRNNPPVVEPVPVNSPTAYRSSGLMEDVKDTCYYVNQPVTPIPAPVFFDHRYIFWEAHFNPFNNNIVHCIYVDTSVSLPHSYIRIITMDLFTNDTFSCRIKAMGPPPQIDQKNWIYYISTDNNVWKIKTNGTQNTQLTFNSPACVVAVKNDGSELLFNKNGQFLDFADEHGVIKESKTPKDYLPFNSVSLLAISPDFSRLLIYAYDIDSSYVVNRETKAIEAVIKGPIPSARFSSDNKKIVSTKGNYTALTIIDLNTLQENTIKYKGSPLFCNNHQYWYPEFSNDGNYILVGWIENRRVDSLTAALYLGYYTSIMDVNGNNERRFKPN